MHIISHSIWSLSYPLTCLPHTHPPMHTRRAKGPFSDAIVFVIGGGNYEEYQDLKEWAKRTAANAAGAGCVSRMDCLR